MSQQKLHFQEGLLVSGTHELSLETFLQEFCSDTSRIIGAYGEASRSDFSSPFRDIYEWARDAGATSIIIGGSFVSKKKRPSDMDIVILFAKSDQIPKSNERYDANGVLLDIQMLSEDQPSIISAFLELLATTRSQVRHGLIQIKVHSTAQTYHRPDVSSPELEIVRVAYLGRRWTREQKVKGIVVPIHGIRTHGEEWLPHLCLTASTSGWAVAPYVYGYRGASILGSKKQKLEVIEGFRNWLIQVRQRYPGPISVIAHSFGTYVIGRYLKEAKDISEKFDAVILCGSVLSRSYDWASRLDEGVVGKVLNTISTNDEWVKFMPDGGMPFLAKDELFGEAGCAGFTTTHPGLTQIQSELLRHNNIFKDDVILSQWIPFLELSKGSQKEREAERIFARLKSRD